MTYSRSGISACLLLSILGFTTQCWAQKGETYRELLTPACRSDNLGTPEHLRNYVVDGKITLSLRDAVVLTLENNSGVRIQETQIESSKFALLGVHSPFDPLLTSYYNVNSSSSAPFSQLQGTGAAPPSSPQHKLPSSITHRPSKLEPTYRPAWAPSTTTPTILSTFTTLTSLRL